LTHRLSYYGSLIAFGLFLQVFYAEPSASSRLPGDYLNRVGLTFVSPSRPYWQPTDLDTLKVLFVIPHQAAAREVAELAQRMPLNYEVVTTSNSEILGAF